jgi:hypothetical protein
MASASGAPSVVLRAGTTSALLAMTLGCTVAGGADAGARLDTPVLDAGMDAGTRTCVTPSDCDDSLACTNDGCAVGNVCRHTPLDELCAAGERCDLAVGCTAVTPTTCTTAAECDDGRACNGVEACVGSTGSERCFPGTPLDCDDGNACTTERCDDALGGCQYEVAAGCDAGSVGPGPDAGVPCDAFELATDVTGSFSVRPMQVASCTGSATYNITTADFSVAAGRLSVRLDRFTLTGPAPTGPDFHVTFSDACATFDLSGSFTCADRWEGSWSATFGGAICSLCPGQSASVRGSRR